MILRDLCDLYELKRRTDPDVMPERYWCKKNVSWEIVIARDGTPVSSVPLVNEAGKASCQLFVPDVQRTSGTRPFFLCDNAEYLLGIDDKRDGEKHRRSVELHEEILGMIDDPAARALLMFVKHADTLTASSELQGFVQNPKSLAIVRFEGDDCFIHERKCIRDAWAAYMGAAEKDSVSGVCLVTGKEGPLAALFPQVTGLNGAQSSGASLVSCNADSFSSYGQKTSTAGFISSEAASKSGAALSYVLKSDKHRIKMGSDFIAFWTDAEGVEADEDIAFFFDPQSLVHGEDEEARELVRTALAELRKGKAPVPFDANTQYYLLGIAPYKARLAVRFFETGSLGSLRDNVVAFLEDTEMVNVRPCSLQQYLAQTSVRGEYKNIPSTLVTSCVRSMVRNLPFPEALTQQILYRTRVDRASNRSWDLGRRAAILKACLLRKARLRGLGNEIERSLTVSLNENNTNRGYLLGRLFALLEKVQLDAIGSANATIRDRYMSAAASTPARVYPQLLKLAQHHISKSDFGGLIDRKIQIVIGLLGDDGFPRTLGLDDQGMFYIGYYQQKQAFYAKADNTNGGIKEN